MNGAVGGAPFGLPVDTAPMEARSATVLPAGEGWQFEPKWDGFRCLAFKAGDAVDMRAKSGKPLGRFFPEVLARLRDCPVERFVLDGELVVPLDGVLSFDALQARLHPAASRIRKLAAETPGRLVLFDLLEAPDGRRMLDQPLVVRRDVLEGVVARAGVPGWIELSAMTRERDLAERWLAEAGVGPTDGVVAKRLDGRYVPGERTMVKVKRLRTADCVVGGFRYQAGTPLVGSLLLGLYDDAGLLDHVGFTILTEAVRAEVTARLEASRAAPGFTGNAPGGPSRWSTARSEAWEPVRPELVVEVRFDHVTGDRFRHGTKLMRWRPDKAPRQCTFAQLRSPD